MQDGTASEEGAVRFAPSGSLEIFDGATWAPYQPPTDDGYGSILKGTVPEDPPADDATAGLQ